MKLNKKVLITITIIGLFLISMAISYAYFSARIFGNESESTISGTAAYLELTFTDGTPEITATNIIPGWSASKTFKVENTGEKTAYYKLVIKDITNPLVDGGLSYQITSNDGGDNIPKRAVLTSNRDISLPIEISVGEEHNYTITTYYNNLEVDQSADKGKTFSYTIGIESAKELVGEPLHWNNPGENTLLTAIKLNYPKAVAPETIPGEEINVKEEVELSATEDDYGTSYYFRGNVQNNYVIFAGKCWKIVRIDGNGNIKLWLWNNTNTCNSKNALQGTKFNDLSNNNAYVGYMYGDINSTKFSTGDFEHPGVHDNIYPSTIFQNLATWYDTTFDTDNTSKYIDMLADVIWCGDKKPTTTSENVGIGTTTTNYGFDGRVSNPTLICQDAGFNGNLSRYTAYSGSDVIYGDINNQKGNGDLKITKEGVTKYYKVGLLTGDEVSFAGGKQIANIYYYLNSGANNWLMSAGHFFNDAFVYSIFYNGAIGKRNVINQDGIRPSIALIPSVTLKQDVQGQDGTKEHPFEIYVPETNQS